MESTEPSKRVMFAISADYERRTGGWIYDQRLMHELRQRGWQVCDLVLPAGFPRPDDAARAQSDAMFAGLADGTIVVVDQLCLGVMPQVARQQAHRLQLVMIVHHPLSLENGLEADERAAFAQSEREVLSHVALVIVTSNTTARDLQKNFAVADARILVAPPGVDRPPRSPGSSGGAPVMLCVGAVVPRKDHATLITALAGLGTLPWRLKIIGNLTRAPDHVAHVQSLIARHGLADRVQLVGELDDDNLNRVWQEADLFVAASRHEGFGMAVAEAVARGLPVVTTAAGAVSEWLGDPVAIVVPTGDVEALRAAIARAVSDPDVRARLRQGAQAARNGLPRWDETATVVDAALTGLVAG